MSSFCTAKATHIFFSKKFQHICVSLELNFNESLTNDFVSFEQLGPGRCSPFICSVVSNDLAEFIIKTVISAQKHRLIWAFTVHICPFTLCTPYLPEICCDDGAVTIYEIILCSTQYGSYAFHYKCNCNTCDLYLTLYKRGKIFSRQHTEIFFQKTGFDILCKLLPLGTICMTCQIRKISSICHLLN